MRSAPADIQFMDAGPVRTRRRRRRDCSVCFKSILVITSILRLTPRRQQPLWSCGGLMRFGGSSLSSCERHDARDFRYQLSITCFKLHNILQIAPIRKSSSSMEILPSAAQQYFFRRRFYFRIKRISRTGRVSKSCCNFALNHFENGRFM